MWNLRKPDLEEQSRVVATRGWGRRKWEILVKGHKLPIIRLVNSEDLMHRMMIIATNTVSCR